MTPTHSRLACACAALVFAGVLAAAEVSAPPAVTSLQTESSSTSTPVTDDLRDFARRLAVRPLEAPPTTPPTTTPTTPPSPPHTHAPPPPVVTAVGDCGGWRDLIAVHFPPEEVAHACRVMLCESGGNPGVANEQGSSASGLWQFLDSTWVSTTGLAPPASAYTPDQQTAGAATLWQRSGWRPWSCR